MPLSEPRLFYYSGWECPHIHFCVEHVWSNLPGWVMRKCEKPAVQGDFGSNNKGIFMVTVTCSGQYGYFVISNWHVKCSRLGCVLGGFKLPKANHHGRWWRVDIPLRTRCSVEFVLNDGGHSISAGWSTVDGRFDWLVGLNLLGTEVGTIIQVRLATTLPKCQACTFW